MTDPGLHRREFLQQLGAASALALSGGAAVVLACGEGRDPLVSALAGLFEEPEAARTVGEAWLAQQSPPPGAAELLDALTDGDAGAARDLARSDPAALLAGLRERHRADFEADRTAEVRGWVLSRTEAQVCGALAQAAGRG
jgi:hypothetical protein